MLRLIEVRDLLTTHFASLQEGAKVLYKTDTDGDSLWDLYLESIPAEHNPIYRVRRSFDCSSCRYFIKRMGLIVAIRDQEVRTIWDFETGDPVWDEILKKLSSFVKEHGIKDVFLSRTDQLGTIYNMEEDEDGEVIRWNHFYVKLPARFVFSGGNDTRQAEISQYRDKRNVFKRALDELTIDAVETVLELINQGSLYRGDEYKHILEEFLKCKRQYAELSPEKQELYAWEKSVTLPDPVAKVRNTAIGTLLIDVTSEMDLDQAVSRYEAVVAPQNYKRSKPVFTQQMVEDAQRTITELGYLDSLERRYANADDITINNVLFSNRDTAKRLQGAGDIFSMMAREASQQPRQFSKTEEIPIEEFIEHVLPTATEIEAYVEGKHIPNMMSLIAPVHKDSKTMFKWNNNFSWAYTGNVTDSLLKQNVKNAGGRVDGVLRFSIQWNDLEASLNDEDAHCIEPDREEICYHHKKHSKSGGNLDVDIIHPQSGIAAVENITWPDKRKMLPGKYQFFVHTYTARGGRGGFRAEIEFDGQIYSFDYAQNTRGGGRIPVANVTLDWNGGFSIEKLLPANVSNREVWGVHTNEFTPVSMICYSPNYWDEQNGIGNKHYFFMLKNCVNPEMPNAFYNEFLNGELYPAHRKVLEALASRMHVQECEDQLSGLGFSSTIRNELVVKVKGNTERILKIKF